MLILSYLLSNGFLLFPVVELQRNPDITWDYLDNNGIRNEDKNHKLFMSSDLSVTLE